MLSYFQKALPLSYFLFLLALLPCMYWGLPESPINSVELCKALQARMTGPRLSSWLSTLGEARADSGTLTTIPLLNEITARIRNHIYGMQESWQTAYDNAIKN